jgi:hypothetical protein
MISHPACAVEPRAVCETELDRGGDREIVGGRSPSRVEELAQFVCRSRWERISQPARKQLQLRVLDSIGVALGALHGEPVAMVREQVREFGGAPLSTLIRAGRGAPDRAAFYNGTLVRDLDFNDSYLAPDETCQPRDNLAPMLAAAEYAHADGRTLLTALAVAYQVQNRLSEVAPRACGYSSATGARSSESSTTMRASHPADGLGCRDGEVRPARRRSRRTAAARTDRHAVRHLDQLHVDDLMSLLANATDLMTEAT